MPLLLIKPPSGTWPNPTIEAGRGRDQRGRRRGRRWPRRSQADDAIGSDRQASRVDLGLIEVVAAGVEVVLAAILGIEFRAAQVAVVVVGPGAVDDAASVGAVGAQTGDGQILYQPSFVFTPQTWKCQEVSRSARSRGKMKPLPRSAVLRLGTAALSLLAVPHAARSDDLSNFVRRAVVRSAQVADQADSVWQQLAGEVVPAWQKPNALPTMTVPPPLLDAAFADALLALPLEAAAKCSGVSSASLAALVPGARQDAALLYQEQSEGDVRPLQNEPFYGALSKPGPAPAGVALRGFAPSLVTAAAAGDFTNSTLFGFEAYARWRVLQAL